jgi:hypothetical protein
MGAGAKVFVLYALRFAREPYRHFADGHKALLSNTTLAAAGSFRMHSPEQRVS